MFKSKKCVLKQRTCIITSLCECECHGFPLPLRSPSAVFESYQASCDKSGRITKIQMAWFISIQS